MRPIMRLPGRAVASQIVDLLFHTTHPDDRLVFIGVSGDGITYYSMTYPEKLHVFFHQCLPPPPKFGRQLPGNQTDMQLPEW
jgi:hypothetical protein